MAKMYFSYEALMSLPEGYHKPSGTLGSHHMVIEPEGDSIFVRGSSDLSKRFKVAQGATLGYNCGACWVIPAPARPFDSWRQDRKVKVFWYIPEDFWAREVLYTRTGCGAGTESIVDSYTFLNKEGQDIIPEKSIQSEDVSSFDWEARINECINYMTPLGCVAVVNTNQHTHPTRFWGTRTRVTVYLNGEAGKRAIERWLEN